MATLVIANDFALHPDGKLVIAKKTAVRLAPHQSTPGETKPLAATALPRHLLHKPGNVCRPVTAAAGVNLTEPVCPVSITAELNDPCPLIPPPPGWYPPPLTWQRPQMLNSRSSRSMRVQGGLRHS